MQFPGVDEIWACNLAWIGCPASDWDVAGSKSAADYARFGNPARPAYFTAFSYSSKHMITTILYFNMINLF